jgi:hypothetical protein
MFVSMKSRAVIKLVPLGQPGGKASETWTGDLAFSTPHAGFQKTAHKSGHAQARLGCFYTQPFGDLLAQRDGNVFHSTNIV